MVESFVLVILFAINGEPAMVDGWGPRGYQHLEMCEIAQTNVSTYLREELSVSRDEFVAGCVENGDADAVQKLKLSLGSEAA